MIEGVSLTPASPVITSNVGNFDVIFVHGIGSDALSAWSNGNGEIWPAWIEHSISGGRPLLLNYPAPRVFSSMSSSVSIRERAENIADYLQSVGIGQRPVIFICHSLGGILVKEILRVGVSNLRLRSLTASVLGVVFLATPHAGSNVASWSKQLGSQLTQDLARDSEYLLDLRNWFSEFAVKNNVFVSSYFEARRTTGVIVVERQSADPQVNGCACIAIDEDHSGICKPANMSSDLFSRLKRDISLSIEKVNKMERSLVSFEDISTLPALTDEMHINIVSILQRRYFSFTPGAVILNQIEASRSLCIIISQNPIILNETAVLEQRWPEKFRVEKGVLGQFTSVKKSDPSSKQITNKVRRNSFRADKKIVQTYSAQTRRTVKTAEKTLREVGLSESDRNAFTNIVSEIVSREAEHNLRVACYRTIHDHTEVFTSLHSLHYSVRNSVEKYVNEAISDDGSIEPNVKASLRKIKGLTSELLSTQLKTCISKATEKMFEMEMTVNFIGTIKATEDSEVPPRLKAEVKIGRVDHSKDLVVMFVRSNEVWRQWAIDKELTHLDVTAKENMGALIEPGAKVSTGLHQGNKLTVESLDNTVYFPMSDRITKLGSIVMLSGGDVQPGSSGTPVLDVAGHVTGMIVGRAETPQGPRVLAVDFSDARAFSTQSATRIPWLPSPD